MSEVKYYTIQLDTTGAQFPDKMFVQTEHCELYLSANGILTDCKMAHLDSEELATEFLEAYRPRLEKRYGPDVAAAVVEFSTRGDSKKIAERIEADSELARKRLETGILAANMSPFEY